MFMTDDPTQLREELDRFATPMFVAQLRPQAAQFEICALNAANERESGMSMPHVAGRPLNELLPPPQAAEVNARYISCLQQDMPIRYRERLQMPKGRMIWDTVLCRLDMPDGRARIVGTALVIDYVDQDDVAAPVAQDVLPCTTRAALKLSQLAHALTAIDQGKSSLGEHNGSAEMLAALCQTINQTLEEVNALALPQIEPVSEVIGPSTTAPQIPPEIRAVVPEAVQRENLDLVR
jgi:PAS domain S-box-containing protein